MLGTLTAPCLRALHGELTGAWETNHLDSPHPNLWTPTHQHAGKTALMVAIQAGHSEAARALLACGVDAARPADMRGNTALHMAAWVGDCESVKLLLSHAEAIEPADQPDSRRMVNAVNLTGLTPLHFAAWKGHGAVLRELINSGANLVVSRDRLVGSQGDWGKIKGATVLTSLLAAHPTHCTGGYNS